MATAAAAGFFSSPLHLKKAKSLSSLKISTAIHAPLGISISPLSLCILTSKNPLHRGGSSRCLVDQNALLEKEEEEERELSTADEGNTETRRKLYVTNFPWDISAPQIVELFAQCGTVKDVEELQGRIIRVQFAKRFRKPPPPPPPGFDPREPVHKIYVSNLAWKARSSNLKELFSEKFNPLSARVVFENPNGRSAGYGFVGFATKAEAEAAISELDGKELMGRPIRLRISLRNQVKAEIEVEEGN